MTNSFIDLLKPRCLKSIYRKVHLVQSFLISFFSSCLFLSTQEETSHKYIYKMGKPERKQLKYAPWTKTTDVFFTKDPKFENLSTTSEPTNK